MTLLPLQHPARPAGHANSAKAHEYRGRYRGERGNETCGEFRLSTPDGVEDEPRVSVVQFLDIPEAGNVNVRNCKRFGKNCAIAIHNDDPQCFEIARSSHSLTRGLANDFSGENRHGVRTVNALSGVVMNPHDDLSLEDMGAFLASALVAAAIALGFIAYLFWRMS